MLPSLSRSPMMSLLASFAAPRRLLVSSSTRAGANSNFNHASSPAITARMRNAKSKVVTTAASSSTLRNRQPMMVGATPAWKRHCIRQRRKALCDSSKHSPTTATTISTKDAIITPKETNNFSMVIDQIKSFSIGSFAGLLGSLAGMGGGFVMIPLMTAARQSISTTSALKGIPWRGGLGLHQHQAHGTSLFAVGTTGLAGALGYGIHFSGDDEVPIENDVPDSNAETATQQQHKQQQHSTENDVQKGLVELDTALALATTAMVTARFGAIASTRLSEKMLQKALGAFMIGVAPLIPGKAYLEALHDVNNPSNPDVPKHIEDPEHGKMSQLERLLPASFIGMFSGFLSGMFGVGGGAIVVPSLVLSTDMSHHSALGTSLCAMVLPAIVGTYTHSMKGNVNWRVAPMLGLGCAMGAYIGGKEVGLNLDEGVLRAGFSCLMLVLGVKTWRKGAAR